MYTRIYKHLANSKNYTTLPNNDCYITLFYYYFPVYTDNNIMYACNTTESENERRHSYNISLDVCTTASPPHLHPYNINHIHKLYMV